MSPIKTTITKPVRRTLMIGLILLFFIIAPLLILYTAGYRYDFDNYEVKKTGVISVDVLPEDATVFLNEKQILSSLPLRLTNTTPGNYHLWIEREGYLPWEKDITVESNQTTYIKDITLLKQSLPISFFDARRENTTYSLSPNGKYIIFISQDKNLYTFSLLDTKTNTETSLGEYTHDTVPVVRWSPLGSGAVFTVEGPDAKTTHLVSIDRRAVVESYTTTSTKDVVTQWDEKTDGALYLQDGTTLIRLHTNIARRPNLLTSPIWYVDAGGAVWLYNPDKQVLVSSGDDTVQLSSVPDRIVFVRKNLLLFFSQGQLFLSRDNEKPQALTVDTIRKHPLTGGWIAWSPWELWSISESGDVSLLSRTGEYIRAVREVDEFGSLLLYTNNGVDVFHPGYYTTHKLLSGVSIVDVEVNADTRRIFFSGTVGNVEDLYDLEF